MSSGRSARSRQLHAQLLEQRTNSFLQARNILSESQQQLLLGFAVVDYSEPWYEFWNWFGAAGDRTGEAKPAGAARTTAAQAGLVRKVSLEDPPKTGDDQQQDQPETMPGQAKDKAEMMQGQAKDKAGMMPGQDKAGMMPGQARSKAGMMPGQAKGRTGASGAMRGMGDGCRRDRRDADPADCQLLPDALRSARAERGAGAAARRDPPAQAGGDRQGAGQLIQAQDNYWIKLGNTRTTLGDMRGVIDELRVARTEYRLSQLDANEEATAVLDDEQQQQAFTMLRDNMGPGQMMGEEPAEEAEE